MMDGGDRLLCRKCMKWYPLYAGSEWKCPQCSTTWKEPRLSKWRKYWVLLGWGGLYWRLCGLVGIKHAYRQMMSGRERKV